jgi:hypothetical protein
MGQSPSSWSPSLTPRLSSPAIAAAGISGTRAGVLASNYLMKYWLYLLAKLAVAVGAAFVLQAIWVGIYPTPPPLPKRFGPAPPLFLHDMLFTFGTLGIWLVGSGLVYVALWDQRRRCRNCLSKLIMPLKTGSWGHLVLIGRPQTQMICRFGHGTLSIEDLQITGREHPDWHRHDDNIWKELESYGQAGK